jgi:hypothetical protein
MIDLQGDERVILQVRKSMAVLAPQALICAIVGFVAFYVALGFYSFRDEFLFIKEPLVTDRGVFHPSPDGWFENGVHENILILGGLVVLAVIGLIAVKIVKGKRAKKRVAQGLPPLQPRQPKVVAATPESDRKALARRSNRRLTSYYKVERYLTGMAMIILVGAGIFAVEKASPWYYVVVTVAPLAAYLFIRWFMTRYALTSKRLIISAGMISNFFWDLPFDKYDEISGEQNFVERILMFGDLTVNSVGGSREVIKNVPHPDYMRKNFHAMREEYRKRIMESAMGRAPEAEGAKGGEGQKEPPDLMP